MSPTFLLEEEDLEEEVVGTNDGAKLIVGLSSFPSNVDASVGVVVSIVDCCFLGVVFFLVL